MDGIRLRRLTVVINLANGRANWAMGEGYTLVNALGLNGISKVPEKHHIRDLATDDPFSEVQFESTWALNICTHLGYQQHVR